MLEDKVRKVVKMKQRTEEAFTDHELAKAKLLAHIIQTVQPAAPALASKIDETWSGCLIGGKGGGSLYLLQNGELAIWCGSIRVISCAEAVAFGYDPTKIAQSLARSLDAQLRGNMNKRAKQARELSKKMHAIVALLER